MSVEMKIRKIAFLPGNRSLAKAYAASVLTMTTSKVVVPAIKRLLNSQISAPPTRNSSTMLLSVGLWGHHCGGSATMLADGLKTLEKSQYSGKRNTTVMRHMRMFIVRSSPPRRRSTFFSISPFPLLFFLARDRQNDHRKSPNNDKHDDADG